MRAKVVEKLKHTFIPKKYNLVTNVAKANAIIDKIKTLNLKNRHFAIDTETVGVDPTYQSPIQNAHLISASIYCGPDVDFGEGPYIWIENTKENLIHLFKPFFEDSTFKKVFHNYSFDYHVLSNYTIRTKGFIGDTLHMARLFDTDRLRYSLDKLSQDYLDRRKVPFKELFEDYTEDNDDFSAENTLQLQNSEDTRLRWIDYCVYDTEATWKLYEKLKEGLKSKPWFLQKSMLDFYKQFYIPFAEILVDMEQTGFQVDKGEIHKSFERAFTRLIQPTRDFLQWAESHEPNAAYLNIRSTRQLQQLLFGPKDDADPNGTGLSANHLFRVANEMERLMPGETAPKKFLSFSVKGMGFKPLSRTATNRPQCNTEVIKKLAGFPFDERPIYGEAIKNFATREEGIKACKAIYRLVETQKIETLLSNYLETLGAHCDDKNRIHCSINLNTNTGRMSARSPNLQNQPAADKDTFKIRKAFVATKGSKLIIADYSQLELRVLAHVSNCSSMIDAFHSGVDFHTKTAIQMFPYVKEAVEKGDVLIEAKKDSQKPSVKQKFGRERQRAKAFNFSIAYGKTSYGFAKDFAISNSDAEKYLKLWYDDRPEVKQWQSETLQKARATKEIRTLMGRYRKLKDIRSAYRPHKSHAERMAINTPIQGGAADIVMMAMLKIGNNTRLKEMGWKLIMQIHDEVIVEGPEEHAEEALELIRDCLEKPFDSPLRVKLDVSIGIKDSWHYAK